VEIRRGLGRSPIVLIQGYNCPSRWVPNASARRRDRRLGEEEKEREIENKEGRLKFDLHDGREILLQRKSSGERDGTV